MRAPVDEVSGYHCIAFRTRDTTLPLGGHASQQLQPPKELEVGAAGDEVKPLRSSLLWAAEGDAMALLPHVKETRLSMLQIVSLKRCRLGLWQPAVVPAEQAAGLKRGRLQRLCRVWHDQGHLCPCDRMCCFVQPQAAPIAWQHSCWKD